MKEKKESWISLSGRFERTCALKPNLVVSRYFMHCASLMQPFSAFWLPLYMRCRCQPKYNE